MQLKGSFFDRNLPWIIFIAFWFAGVVLLLINSPWGIGVTHDSVFYISSASNLTEGEGLYWIGDAGRLRPLTHFAPLYPILLSPFIAIGVDPEVVALGLAAVSYGLIISVIGYYVYQLTNRIGLGVLASVLALISPVIIGVHTIALSEPVFLLVTLGFLISLSRFLSDPRWPYFIIISILAAIGYLTRYVGITLLFTGAAGIIVLGKIDFRKRIRYAFLFLLTAFIPMGIWMLRNYSLTGTLTNRTLLFHPPSGEAILIFLDTLTSWVLPLNLSLRYQVVGLILSALIFIYLLIRGLRSLFLDRQRWVFSLGIMTIFLVVYLLSLAFSITFVDASTPLDNRILSPAYLGISIVITLLLGSFAVQSENKVVLLPIVLFLAVVLWNNWSGTSEILRDLRENGIGFSARGWHESETIAWLSGQPDDALIYTNERFAITYITGRPAYSIPEKINTVTAEVRPEFDQALATMHDRLEMPHSYLLLFHPYGLRYGMPTRDEITFPLSRLEEFNDALVYIDPINME